MLVVYSRNKVPIRLTSERWRHILTFHPELRGQRLNVLETVSDPDLIQNGDFGELLAARFYTDRKSGDKHLVVAYREMNEHDGFVLTGYYTRRLSARREILWKH